MPRTRAGRWQWQVAASAVCLTVLLIASRSYRLWHLVNSRSPGGFYDHCCMELEMWETKLLEWVNLPALILSAPVRAWDHTIYVRRGFGILASDLAYLLATGLFWWWVGKQFDQGWRPAGSVDRAVYYVLAALGILLVVAGSKILVTTRGLDSFALNISVSLICWGIFFSSSFTYRIRWLKAHPAI
jgi:hypothetical protein